MGDSISEKSFVVRISNPNLDAGTWRCFTKWVFYTFSKKTTGPHLWETSLRYFLQQIKSNCTAFRFWISNGWGNFPLVLRSWGPRGSEASEVLEGSWDPEVLGVLGVLEVPGILGVQGAMEVPAVKEVLGLPGSQNWVPLFYHDVWNPL